MAVALYMDVHIPMPITRQLRHRGVDVMTATEERTNRLLDERLLDLATSLNRVLVTHDIRFRAYAEYLQRSGEHFAGLIYGHARRISIRKYVADLELIAKVYEPSELKDTIVHLPFP